MVQAANSGHPGAPMGCAPMAHLLWSEVMAYDPKEPSWWNRDRFVLSNGHACALQYTMLHLTGYDLSVEDCKAFRQVGSKTPGHPENFVTAGVEVSTGPLGQGISNAVGMAIGEKHLEAVYNSSEFPLFTNFTYVICGDGCLQEGVSSEACSLAGHLGLGKLIVLYDDNSITIDGPTSLSFTEDVSLRYEAYGWHVQTVSDVGSNLEGLRAAVSLAKSVADKPSLIKVKTVIGHGSMKEGSHKTHGAPLGEADIQQAKSKFGLDPNVSFQIEEDVQSFYKSKVTKAADAHTEWKIMYQKYESKHPDKAKELKERFSHTLPADADTSGGLFSHFPSFKHGVDKDLATRKMSSNTLNALAPHLPSLMGGSADLTPSNLTSLTCSDDFQKDTPDSRYIRFGVREHGMAAICNGLFAYGGFRPYCATFLNFAGYALGAMRVAALSRFGIIYIMTHDSIGLGEDGPTHQPVEMLESLRSMPNINVWRPADVNEVNAAYQSAITHFHTPTIIACSRQTSHSLEQSSIQNALKGGYVAIDTHQPHIILLATGAEVGLCVKAAEQLNSQNINTKVVSMPCRELFTQQTIDYQHQILPGDVPTLLVEAAAVGGWPAYSHAQIAVKRFGLSGKGPDLLKKFGFTVEHIVQKSKDLQQFYKGKTVPNLNFHPDFDCFDKTDKDH
eukprot:CAMPEP_0172486126 /NCGR_PEP_ID=MMETSP1066-20121228/14550_1 /TAXON_ID=671091 /ORGANISM="Coscinodiscus wailesii, Strain CCMP2513" /LENGTH=672 /DNA_ID=CAMNT_0013251873 /DNA_START=296 /DNA_END=2314 /DNA_ORIENTATION=+